MRKYTATLGHAQLKVRDLSRSVAFYTTVLGLDLTEQFGDLAFLGSGGAHHELALQQLGAGASPVDPDAVGLNHLAWTVPDHDAFALAFNTLVASGVTVDAADHGISWSLYFRDPDGNAVEIHLDRRGDPDGSTAWAGTARELLPAEIVDLGKGRKR